MTTRCRVQHVAIAQGVCAECGTDHRPSAEEIAAFMNERAQYLTMSAMLETMKALQPTAAERERQRADEERLRVMLIRRGLEVTRFAGGTIELRELRPGAFLGLELELRAAGARFADPVKIEEA